MEYCIRIRGMYKTGRALKGTGRSTIPMTFSSVEDARSYMIGAGIAEVTYVSPMVFEEDYYVKTWDLEKIKLIRVKSK